MRELKFRYWDHVKNEYKYSGDVYADVGLSVFFSDAEHYGFAIEQFTGLLDSKGRECYEGDIVQPYNVYGNKLGGPQVIAWEDRMFKMGDSTDGLSGIWYNVFEIIGNIHESE